MQILSHRNEYPITQIMLNLYFNISDVMKHLNNRDKTCFVPIHLQRDSTTYCVVSIVCNVIIFIIQKIYKGNANQLYYDRKRLISIMVCDKFSRLI